MLTAGEARAVAELLHRGLVLIRLAALDGDNARVAAIADALENIPSVLAGEVRGWKPTDLGRLFLRPLVEKYPDTQNLVELLPPLMR